MTPDPSPTRASNPSQARRNLWSGRARVAEAAFLLTAASAAQKWVPMPRWSRVLGVAAAVPGDWQGQRVEGLSTSAASVLEYRVASAVRRGARLLPWTPTCLAEAAAAQVMLARRGAPGVVVVGLRPGPSATGTWDAHAWLLGRQGALTGGPAAEGFSATTVFEREGGLRASEVDLSPRGATRG